MFDSSEILSVIFEQERTIYKCNDYLSPGFYKRRQVEETKNTNKKSFSRDTPSTQSLDSSQSSTVDESWRELICQWYFQVIDHYEYNRETVAISLSYLDRFVASRPMNRRTFQLAAMTTLYLAIKLFEHCQIKASDLAKLSQGCFVTEHIVMMEESILRALSWHVHPPTSVSVINLLIPILIRVGYDKRVIHEIVEYSRFLTELSVCNYYFVTRRASSIGLAAVLVSFDHLDTQKYPQISSDALVEGLRYIYPQEKDHIKEIEDCKTRLITLYANPNKHDPQVHSDSCAAYTQCPFHSTCQ